jgi:hypothetical protein
MTNVSTFLFLRRKWQIEDGGFKFDSEFGSQGAAALCNLRDALALHVAYPFYPQQTKQFECLYLVTLPPCLAQNTSLDLFLESASLQ